MMNTTSGGFSSGSHGGHNGTISNGQQAQPQQQRHEEVQEQAHPPASRNGTRDVSKSHEITSSSQMSSQESSQMSRQSSSQDSSRQASPSSDGLGRGNIQVEKNGQNRDFHTTSVRPSSTVNAALTKDAKLSSLVAGTADVKNAIDKTEASDLVTNNNAGRNCEVNFNSSEIGKEPTASKYEHAAQEKQNELQGPKIRHHIYKSSLISSRKHKRMRATTSSLTTQNTDSLEGVMGHQEVEVEASKVTNPQGCDGNNNGNVEGHTGANAGSNDINVTSTAGDANMEASGNNNSNNASNANSNNNIADDTKSDTSNSSNFFSTSSDEYNMDTDRFSSGYEGGNSGSHGDSGISSDSNSGSSRNRGRSLLSSLNRRYHHGESGSSGSDDGYNCNLGYHRSMDDSGNDSNKKKKMKLSDSPTNSSSSTSSSDENMEVYNMNIIENNREDVASAPNDDTGKINDEGTKIKKSQGNRSSSMLISTSAATTTSETMSNSNSNTSSAITHHKSDDNKIISTSTSAKAESGNVSGSGTSSSGDGRTSGSGNVSGTGSGSGTTGESNESGGNNAQKTANTSSSATSTKDNIKNASVSNENNAMKNNASSSPSQSIQRELKPDPYFYYLDHSQEKEEDPMVPLVRPLHSPSFVIKLHAILMRNDLEGIICWLPHGRSWKIVHEREFEIRTLPTYFNHTRIASFYRLAHEWGFRRLSKGEDQGSFYHERFLRGLPHLCKKLKASTFNNNIVDKEPNTASHEPNLWIITSEHSLPERLDPDGVECRELKLINECILDKGHRAKVPATFVRKEAPRSKPQESSLLVKESNVQLDSKLPQDISTGGNKRCFGVPAKFRRPNRKDSRAGFSIATDTTTGARTKNSQNDSYQAQHNPGNNQDHTDVTVPSGPPQDGLSAMDNKPMPVYNQVEAFLLQMQQSQQQQLRSQQEDKKQWANRKNPASNIFSTQAQQNQDQIQQQLSSQQQNQEQFTDQNKKVSNGLFSLQATILEHQQKQHQEKRQSSQLPQSSSQSTLPSNFSQQQNKLQQNVPNASQLSQVEQQMHQLQEACMKTNARGGQTNNTNSDESLHTLGQQQKQHSSQQQQSSNRSFCVPSNFQQLQNMFQSNAPVSVSQPSQVQHQRMQYQQQQFPQQQAEAHGGQTNNKKFDDTLHAILTATAAATTNQSQSNSFNGSTPSNGNGIAALMNQAQGLRNLNPEALSQLSQMLGGNMGQQHQQVNQFQQAVSPQPRQQSNFSQSNYLNGSTPSNGNGMAALMNQVQGLGNLNPEALSQLSQMLGGNMGQQQQQGNQFQHANPQSQPQQQSNLFQPPQAQFSNATSALNFGTSMSPNSLQDLVLRCIASGAQMGAERQLAANNNTDQRDDSSHAASNGYGINHNNNLPNSGNR